jgi:hypothetical protein
MVRLSFLIYVLVAVLAVAGLCWSQPGSATVEAGLRVHAVAKMIVSPMGGLIELHWIPDPYPGASNVLVSNPVLAQKLEDTLGKLADDDLCKGAWVLENSQTCTLGAKIETALREFTFSFKDDVNLLDPPEEEGKQLDLTLRIEYTIPQPRAVEAVVAVISTENVKPDAEAIELTMSAMEAAKRIGATDFPPDPIGNEVITVILANQDLARPSGQDFPISRLQDTLLRVGLNALKIAADQGLIIDKPAPQNDNQLTLIDDAIEQVYQIERPAWPAIVRTTHDGGKYTIALRDLRFVASVDTKVVRGQIPGEQGPVDFRGATEAGEARLARILKEASERAHRFMEANGTVLEGAIPTRTSVLAVVETLQKLPEIREPIDILSAGTTMIFQATYRWIDATIDAKIGLQVGYDPEQLFTGGGKAHAHNLLGTLFHHDILDDLDFDAGGGPEVQRAALTLNISRNIGTSNLFTYGTNFLMHIARDRNQRMGNLPAARGQEDKSTQLIDEERGLQPKLFLQYDRAGYWKNRIRLESALDWRRVLVRPQLSELPALADGQLTAWDVSVEETFWHEFTSGAKKELGCGIGEVIISFSGEMRRAMRQLGGDFDYQRPQFSVMGEGLFGWRTRQELIVRHTWGAGYASAGTPIFQLYRLGGSNNVRGVEEGEFVGRNLRFQQSTLGIALPVFFPVLNGAEGLLAALTKTYVTGFYDRGEVEQNQIRHFANGYGFAVEIRNLPAGNRHANISIGWARSPQSFLHRRGVSTLGVKFDF